MVNKDTIKVLEYKELGKLPNPFLMENGDIANTYDKWREQRKMLAKTAVDLQYGVMPPEPEFLEIEPMYLGESHQSFRIITGTKAKPIVFTMKAMLPNSEGPFATVIDGDACFPYSNNNDFCKQFYDSNIMLVMFNRVEIAPDVYSYERRTHGQIYDTYPDLDFGALAAWAWGYHRTLDALIKLGYVDKRYVAFTGHSRGGKTALLAGATDERATIVNPNCSGAGGAGCYRVHAVTQAEGFGSSENEKLRHLMGIIGFWFNDKLMPYINDENSLPFDEHFLKALVAPRILLDTEAVDDGWANPVGTYQTNLAAKEVWKMLGAEKNFIWRWRNGSHAHTAEDVGTLIKVMNYLRVGQPLDDTFFVAPFEAPAPMYDWKY